ncbi:unnamed protein product, partial [Effrenium voratum]
ASASSAAPSPGTRPGAAPGLPRPRRCSARGAPAASSWPRQLSQCCWGIASCGPGCCCRPWRGRNPRRCRWRWPRACARPLRRCGGTTRSS